MDLEEMVKEYPNRIEPEGLFKSKLIIYIDYGILLDCWDHAIKNSDREVGGVLLGEQFMVKNSLFVVLEKNIRGQAMIESTASLKFTQKTWENIYQIQDEQFPDKQILGWYHTHPGFGVFLSGYDLYIHKNFFNTPAQIALVLEPLRKDLGFFCWQEDKIIQKDTFGLLNKKAFTDFELDKIIQKALLKGQKSTAETTFSKLSQTYLKKNK